MCNYHSIAYLVDRKIYYNLTIYPNTIGFAKEIVLIEFSFTWLSWLPTKDDPFYIVAAKFGCDGVYIPRGGFLYIGLFFLNYFFSSNKTPLFIT